MRAWLIFVFVVGHGVSAIGQETPAAETEETIVIKDTGGERADAKQPELGDVEQAIVRRTNAFRKEHRRPAVSTNEDLSQAAQSFADFMAKTGKYGHAANGQKPAARVKEAGYKYCIVRENIAYAFRTEGFTTDELASQFVEGWEQSPGHRRNMLARWITGTGVAVAKSDETDTYFAVQVFGRPETSSLTYKIVNESETAVRYRISGREYAIEPRMIRTHQACTPDEVVFLPATRTAATANSERAVASITPESGDTMLVSPAETEGYQVTVKHKEPSAREPAQNLDR